MPAPTNKPSDHPEVSGLSADPHAKPTLVLVWSRDEPQRVGETLLFEGDQSNPLIFGRGTPDSSGIRGRIRLGRQRPGGTVPTGQLISERLSREHLAIRREGDGLHIQNIGKRSMLLDNEIVTQTRVIPGQCIEIKGTILLYCTLRLPEISPCPSIPGELHPFGKADAFGIAGESPLIWALRDRLAHEAPRSSHVLLRGAAGTGKELAAAAIHYQSPRRERPFIAKNAATLSSDSAEAELFGSGSKPGIPERTGLVEAAEGSTLFFDRIGELSHTMQMHLLKVLERGEYRRLGESQWRKADFRLIAAESRVEDELKADLLARFGIQIELSGLNERAEDIPLLAKSLIKKFAGQDPTVAARFFEGGTVEGEPRFGHTLMRTLVTHRYTTHARQLMSMLWSAMISSTGNILEIDLSEASSELPGAFMSTVPATPVALAEDIDSTHLSPQQIQACIDKSANLEDAWKSLGLKSKVQLMRLTAKHGLRIKGGGIE